jgi:5S rRNA maturation endonuclease (ribonuclease M5)
MPRPSKSSKPANRRRDEQPTGCTLQQLAEAKGLPIELLRGMGWSDTYWYGTPCVGIRYPNGALRYRVGLTGKNRFKWQSGSTPGLYGAERLVKRDQAVLVVEGETDVAACTFLGISAVGAPGAGAWKPEWTQLLDGRDVVLWMEPDKGGQTLADTMSRDIPGLQVIDAEIAGHKDLCELLAAFDGDIAGARSYLDGLMEDAEPVAPDLPEREQQEHVGRKERGGYSPFLSTDTAPRSRLWEAAEEYFPVQGKPWKVKPKPLYNHSKGTGLFAEFPSNTWKNPANAQLKRQRLFFNMLPRINGPQLYILKAPIDDWGDAYHEAVSTRIRRGMKKAGDEANYGWLWFNNALDRGYYLYLTSVPGVSGFEPFKGDVEPVLVDALKAIHPPEEDSGKFHPYGGSGNWTTKVDSTGEADRERWDIVGAGDGPDDFIQIEAECVVSGIPYEYVRPYWRQQVGLGLEMKMPFEEFMQFCVSLGYAPTRAGRAGLNEPYAER